MELSAPEGGHCLLGHRRQAACDEVTALTIGRLLQQLAANMTAAASAGARGGANGTSAAEFGRLALFSAHDVTLLPLLSALGQHQRSWPGFASWLSFELWRDDGGAGHSVRVLHNGEPLRLSLPGPAPRRTAAALVSGWAARGRAAAAALLRLAPGSPLRHKGVSHEAFVVPLQNFLDMLGRFVLTPSQYAAACAAGAAAERQQR